MDNALYVAISRQSGLVDKLNVGSNNLANVNTGAFKGRSTEFKELVVNQNNRDTGLSFSAIKGTPQDDSPGGFQKTGGKLDLALKERGAYFAVSIPNVEGLVYTRSGGFSPDSEGALVNQDGYHVASTDGGDIIIPDGVVNLVVSREGDVMAGDEVLGRIGVFDLPDSSLIENIGRSLVRYGNADGIAASTSPVLPGFLEDSNVESVREISGVIGTQRQVEQSVNLSNLLHDLQKSSITSLLSDK